MSSDVKIFLEAALKVGLASRLAELNADVDRAIADYPPTANRRYLARLEDQRERLRQPDLKLIASVVRVLCADHPERLAQITPIATQLAARPPYLVGLAERTA